MPKMKISEALRGASELIDEYGHCKREYSSGLRHCAWGAINRVVTGSSWRIRGKANKAAAKYFADFLVVTRLAPWNDVYIRTETEVVLALGFAAELAKDEGL